MSCNLSAVSLCRTCFTSRPQGNSLLETSTAKVLLLTATRASMAELEAMLVLLSVSGDAASIVFFSV